ncbi:MAG: methyltransferase domain-containing protein [Candidatus Hydrogenedentes bacterium]|nr:methyltransferase domain-containing protein [Candidatus Hydrogenedentota bacterium]
MTTVILAVIVAYAIAVNAEPLLYPSDQVFTQHAADQMARVAAESLGPVYGPLAEQIVADYGLSNKRGIGIDIGSGPGNLIVELCKRTPMYWINADINPHFFGMFMDFVEKAGLVGRVGAVFADVQALPFRDNYADIITSRGSFQFWHDKKLAFSEIYRVLKPGGVAYIGRGFSRDLPPEIAREVRKLHAKAGKNGPPPYDVMETKKELIAVMNSLGIKNYSIQIPKPAGSEGIKYGIWLEIRK